MSRVSWMPLIVSIAGFLHSVSSAQQCSGTFGVPSAIVNLFVQQNVTSQDDVVECRYTFGAPARSGLLFYVSSSTDHGEIPGCPVQIYGDTSKPPVKSLCGRRPIVVEVKSSKAVVSFRPVYNGSAYGLTVHIEVRPSNEGVITSLACGDAEIHAVPSVPLKFVPASPLHYGRDDGFCEIKVYSSAADESMGTRCVFGDGGCRYQIVLKNGTILEGADQDVGIVGGEVTVRFYPHGLVGEFSLTLPAGFEPCGLNHELERPSGAVPAFC